MEIISGLKFYGTLKPLSLKFYSAVFSPICRFCKTTTVTDVGRSTDFFLFPIISISPNYGGLNHRLVVIICFKKKKKTLMYNSQHPTVCLLRPEHFLDEICILILLVILIHRGIKESSL